MGTSQAPREIELKFELDTADVPRLRSLLQRKLGIEATVTHQVSVYYDTPARDLESAGISLRVRSAGERLLQTVKRSRGHAAALFERDEWECDLLSQEPDLVAFARTPAGEALGDKALKLAPVFETLVDRTTWEIAHRSSLIEVALDDGRVVAGRRSERLTELELELKRGEPRQLFEVLGRISEIGSLRPGTMAKSERGYRLVRNKPAKASKAEALRLDKRFTAAQAFQTIVSACLRHFNLNAPLVIGRRAPEALHQSRVALRRLRSALSLFKDLVSDRPYGALVADIRTISQALGVARDLDVYLAESARPDLSQATNAPDAKLFLAEMQRRREVAYDDVVARLTSSEFRALLIRLVEWLSVGPWVLSTDPVRVAAREEPVRRAASRILEKRRRRVKRRGRDLAELDPPARHRVRIEAKKLRYASEFFAGIVSSEKPRHRHASFVAALGDLQEHLGRLNDIETGHEIAVSFSGRGAPQGLFAAAHVSGRQDAEIAAHLAAAGDARRRLVRTKRFWSAWDA